MARNSQGRQTRVAFAELKRVARRFAFEPHDIARQLDAQGRYEVDLDREFPFLIKLFHFSRRHHTRALTWHERLELFLPLDGEVRLQMGDQMIRLAPGDLLVVDNLKLHRVTDFPGFNTRVIVISFLPEFVYSLGSPSHDYAFLLPFYSKLENQPHVLRPRDAAAAPVHRAMAALLQTYFQTERDRFYRAGCKAFFLELLYHLARRFESSELLQWEFVRQQERSLRLKKLFDHISRNFAEKLSVAEAARLSGMSEPRFMKLFKQVAGMTLIAYLHHVRLSNAARLLKETTLSIAEIADRAGFSDQSYFDKRFKKSFGQAPTAFRAAARPQPAGIVQK